MMLKPYLIALGILLMNTALAFAGEGTSLFIGNLDNSFHGERAFEIE